VYFAALPAAAEKFAYTQPFIAEAAQVAANEVLTANEVWTLGDFWTGNVLVSAPDGHDEPEVTILDLELAKPGTAAFSHRAYGCGDALSGALSSPGSRVLAAANILPGV
jgi:hypothetical protein